MGHFVPARGKTVLKLKRENIRFAPRIILPCIALGLATFIMQASESVISVCFNSSLLKYGGDIAVGAMTILTSVMQFAMLLLQGVAQGAQPILSYNFGAKMPTVLKDFFPSAHRKPLLFRRALGFRDAGSENLCRNIQPESGACKFHR